jgi:hypothetical protein
MYNNNIQKIIIDFEYVKIEYKYIIPKESYLLIDLPFCCNRFFFLVFDIIYSL